MPPNNLFENDLNNDQEKAILKKLKDKLAKIKPKNMYLLKGKPDRSLTRLQKVIDNYEKNNKLCQK